MWQILLQSFPRVTRFIDFRYYRAVFAESDIQSTMRSLDPNYYVDPSELSTSKAVCFDADIVIEFEDNHP